MVTAPDEVHVMKATLVAMFAVLLLAGCGEGSDNESYTGVPKDGRSCVEAYKKPANVAQCTQAASRH